jgi:hypothetical protein
MDDTTPAKMVEIEMERLSLSREVAISFLTLGFEASLRAEGPDEESIWRKFGELLLREGKKRTPWLTEYSVSCYRKNLPGWILLNDQALEQGQDPVTVMSVAECVTMGLARDRIALVAASKAGKSIEEIVELSYQRDEAKPEGELYAEFLANFGSARAKAAQ